ncbi:MAG: filamentation induced by cAMP protein [Planctomycetota bacterium]|nr:MAG: filamentation induced by cAMP protein [Planctomycetota bacterium]
MNPSDFAPSSPGRLVSVGPPDVAYHAFVPAPLPPAFDWSPRLIAEMSLADRALGELAGLGRTLPNPHLLIGPFTRREALLTSRIEGSEASMSDLVLFEANPTSERDVRDAREVSNYIRALEHGLSRLKSLPLSLRLLREIHAILLQGVRGGNLTPGEFRTSQNWIGPAGSNLRTATFVPPPVDELLPALDAFEKFLHAPAEIPLLARLALLHYQFETIHPFLDGNGRVGRLLVTLVLCGESVLPGPLLYISAPIERRREEYYARLIGVTRRGEWTAWIEFFLQVGREAALDGVTRAHRLVALREEFRARLQSVGTSPLPLRIADALFTWPALNTARVCELLGISQVAAMSHLRRLEAAKILREATGQKRNLVFIADEIVRIME